MITVAICTYNRSELLDKTLAQLARAHAPLQRSWEVLVVNNRCTDSTDEVIARYTGPLPIRRVYQEVQGLSNARNAAIENAQGEYIIWTDDDVLVDEDWLLAYEKAFSQWPEAAVFGGPVLPWFEVDPPAWITENWSMLASAYATRNLGDSVISLSYKGGLLPYGANFCVRRTEQARFPFDPRLGRNPKKTVLGEETVVMQSLFNSGSHGWWLPNARVKHWIPASRMTFDYLRDYYRGLGRTDALTEPLDSEARLFRVPRWLWRRYFRFGFRYLWAKTFGGQHAHLQAMRDFEKVSARISQLRETT